MYTYFCAFERFANGLPHTPEYKFNAIFTMDNPIVEIQQIQALEKEVNGQLENPLKGYCVLTNLVRL